MVYFCPPPQNFFPAESQYMTSTNLQIVSRPKITYVKVRIMNNRATYLMILSFHWASTWLSHNSAVLHIDKYEEIIEQ